MPADSNQNPQAGPALPQLPQMPPLPWQAYVVIAALSGTSGLFGANFGAAASTADLEQVERQVDLLTDKIGAINIAIARAHPEINQ